MVIGLTLVLSASLVPPRPALLALVALAVALILLRDRLVLHRALRLALRLKWFFLSLVFLFGWLPPGAESGWSWMPTAWGLAEAGSRILALLVLVAWIAWVMQAFHRTELIAGLSAWLRPLGWLGVSGERFAQRLFLAIAYFEERRAQVPTPRRVDGMSRASRWWALHEQLVGQIVWAMSAPPEPPESPKSPKSPKSPGTPESPKSPGMPESPESAKAESSGAVLAHAGGREWIMALVGLAIFVGLGAHVLGLEAGLSARVW